ncbi:hypothetical protein [Mycolicibacterium fluoranthenivorans]|uniref:Uncharacterized protein n=1 Tax=Mycolicibacterium fluoranthenivorans TaxID=258505 RepID=A0A1G4X4F6_9MYCO|nr:hypothetical protein [Mycolicibacterium fluoranthenivorans]SCX34529.1 hypothetical protein SAMN02799620_06368 [Mycolicibacterium fluoranthenivorans]
MSNDEVIQPPRGYGIGLFGHGHQADAIVGCWATEDEARTALADMRIVVIGGPPGWHEWCGATLSSGEFCSKTRGHVADGDDWHDNGSVAWPDVVL